MSDTCLFDMEFEDFNKHNNLNIDPISIIQEIEQELSEKLFNQKSEGDSKDGSLNFIENLTNNLQIEFDKTLGEDADKKLFIRSLTKIFAIVLSTRADSVEKIKNIKIAVKTFVKICRGQNIQSDA